MIQGLPEDRAESAGLHATVERIGRWTYLVVIRDGLMRYGPDGCGWHVLGRRWANSKARRELAKYRRSQQWKCEASRIPQQSIGDDEHREPDWFGEICGAKHRGQAPRHPIKIITGKE